MNPQTEKDLKKIKEINLRIDSLENEKRQVIAKCPCYDYIPKIEETLAFEVNPKALCPVCGKENGELSLEEKINLLEDYLNTGYPEDCCYSPEEIKNFATAGGFNYSRRIKKCTCDEKDYKPEECPSCGPYTLTEF